MQDIDRNDHRSSGGSDKKLAPILRSAMLFVNFFLIITALYQIKPASRSLILDAIAADHLPYVWVISALTLFVTIALYHQILKIFSRLYVVLGSALLFMIALIVFRSMLEDPGLVNSVAFYVFVDIIGVVMVEQFWSLANSIFSTRDGKSWYGLVGTGGLLGGVTGSGLGAILISYTHLQTPDLLLVAAGVLGLIIVLTALMGRLGVYDEKDKFSTPLLGQSRQPADNNTLQRRYLLLIAAALLMAQLVSPLVEFQFMKIVETAYPEREARTATLSVFFSVLSGFSIVVNLMITPFILRRLGILAGLLVQPVMLSAATVGFSLNTGFIAAAVMKIADRGLSYSINRAAKELLYIPVDTLVMYHAKAWIDMFGYRTFKMVGALLILLLTQWTSLSPAVISLNWVIISGCLIWVAVLIFVYQDYRILDSRAVVPVKTE